MNPMREPDGDMADLSQVDAAHVDQLRLPRAHDRLLWTISALSIALIAWLCLSEVDIVSSAPGRVVPDGRLKTVQAAEAGVVVAIHGAEGQQVSRDDLLFEFDPTMSETEQRSVRTRLDLATLEFARIDAELSEQSPVYPAEAAGAAAEGGPRASAVALQEQLRLSRLSSFQAKRAQAEIAVDSARNTLRSARSMVGNLEQISAYARDQEQQLRPHVGQVVSRFSYEATRQAMLDKENDLAMQRARVMAAEGELQVSEKRLRLVREEHQSLLVEELNQKRRELVLLRAEDRRMERLQGLKAVRSPVDGQIQSVGVTTPGGVVAAAQVLATIVPRGMPLVVEVNLPNAEAGFVRLGQGVKVKLDAYPFMQYGALAGVVERISPDAEGAAGDGVPGAGAATPAFYRVRVTLDAAASGVDSRIRIKPGLTAQVDIATGRRRLIQFFIQPLIRHWEETVTLR